jgi:hypothetical protein
MRAGSISERATSYRDAPTITALPKENLEDYLENLYYTKKLN